MKRTWAPDAPFDFRGRFHPVRGAHSDVRLQTPHPLIMFGGASEGALEMGAAECDVFAIYAELRATTAERIAERNGAKTTEPGYERLRALAAQIMAEHTDIEVRHFGWPYVWRR
jgi:alkanesulfonate monooxygenase SsuD/methylene tetrahydromethanopterin reductase-like flavin-dependent oxidoreductase (luciferase family)